MVSIKSCSAELFRLQNLKRIIDKISTLFYVCELGASADLFYLAGVYVPDPYLTMLYQGESYAFVNQLEYGRVASKSKYDHVFLLEQVKQDLAGIYKCELAAVGPALIMRHYASQFQQTELAVPHEFPAIYFSKLQAYGLKVHCRPWRNSRNAP